MPFCCLNAEKGMVIFMKKFSAITLIMALILPIMAVNAAAAQDVTVDNVAFAKSGEEIFVIAEGNVSVTAKATNNTAAPQAVCCISAAYEDSRLTAVKFSVETVAPSAAQEISVKDLPVKGTDKEVKFMAWNRNGDPFIKAESLNSLSRKVMPEIKSDEAGILLLANPDDKTVSVYSADEIANKAEVPVKVNGKDETLDLSSSSTTVTFTAPQGNTEEYTVTLNDSLGTLWFEQYDNAGIADNGTTCTANNRKTSHPFCPTYGTWNDGAYLWDMGMWNGASNPSGRAKLADESDNDNNTNLVLSVASDLTDAKTGESSTNWALASRRKGSGESIYYTLRHKLIPDITTATNPALTEAVYSVDFFQKVDPEKPLNNQISTKIFLGGTGFIAGNNQRLQYISTGSSIITSNVKYKNSEFNKWHNLTSVQKKNSDGNVDCKLYFDGILLGTTTVNYGGNTSNGVQGPGLLTNKAFGFECTDYASDYATVYFDNNIILGRE